jgi:hypothetical protein
VVRSGGNARRPSAFLFRNRFALLLATIALLVVVATIIGQTGGLMHPGVTRCAVSAAFAVVLLSAVNAVSASRHLRRFAFVLVTPTVLLHIADMILGREETEIAKIVTSAAALVYVIILILQHIFSTRTVTADTIFASICVYVLLGLLWANLYAIVSVFDAGAFVVPDSLGQGDKLRFGDDESIVAIYYSFVTMTTLGYGDVLPRSATARMLAVMASVIGQLYVAVLVARLVGIHVAGRADSPPED